MKVRKKDSIETSYEVSARILVFGTPQDSLNYLPPLQCLPSKRTSDFYLPESSGRFRWNLPSIKRTRYPGVVFSFFIYRGRENVLRWKKSDEK